MGCKKLGHTNFKHAVGWLGSKCPILECMPQRNCSNATPFGVPIKHSPCSRRRDQATDRELCKHVRRSFRSNCADIDQDPQRIRRPNAASYVRAQVRKISGSMNDNTTEGPRAHPHQLKRFITTRIKSVRDQLDGKSEGYRLSGFGQE